MKGIAVVPEWWGVESPKSDIPALCDRLRVEGFRAEAVDVYDGRTAVTEEEAASLAESLDRDRAVRLVAATCDRFRREGCEEVVALGFCLGGLIALRCAFEVEGLDRAVVFYGLGNAAERDPSTLQARLLAHFALHDEHVDVAKARALAENLRRAKKPAEIHFYDAHHAFLNSRRPEVYDPAAASLAWERTIRFLR